MSKHTHEKNTFSEKPTTSPNSKQKNNTAAHQMLKPLWPYKTIKSKATMNQEKMSKIVTAKSKKSALLTINVAHLV